jgi:dTDP-4-dehydrorhamnose 3,5-epimerase
MIFTPTELDGATIVDPQRREDARGWFSRVFCEKEFAEHGLPTRIAQTNMSLTRHRGTLRGMHYQVAPHAEDKLVWCAQGAIWDAIVDLRSDSPTYRKWIGVELSKANGRMLLVPKGFAHGFVTLTDDCAVIYQVSEFYTPTAERGLRWNDPAIGIRWPVEVKDTSDKDRNWPDHAIEGSNP